MTRDDLIDVGLYAAAALSLSLLGWRLVGGKRMDEGLYLLDRLASASYPGRPGPHAAVYVPPGFDPSAPLEVALYFRGLNNCVANVVGAVDGACAQGRRHNASHLVQQFAAARQNALFVVPELGPDESSSAPGALTEAGGLERLLDEILGVRMAPILGRQLGARDVARLSVTCHSGGYLATAGVVRHRPAALREVVLLDALYGHAETFADWIADGREGFLSGALRFGCVYTSGGGTREHSRALATRVAPLFSGTGAMLDDDSTRTLDAGEYAPLVFKRSALSHTDVSRYYPKQFWVASAGARI